MMRIGYVSGQCGASATAALEIAGCVSVRIRPPSASAEDHLLAVVRFLCAGDELVILSLADLRLAGPGLRRLFSNLQTRRVDLVTGRVADDRLAQVASPLQTRRERSPARRGGARRIIKAVAFGLGEDNVGHGAEPRYTAVLSTARARLYEASAVNLWFQEGAPRLRLTTRFGRRAQRLLAAIALPSLRARVGLQASRGQRREYG